jgi:phosphopantothenoylcysteine decarboxylase/phosphopantothenate--cysteine ligase
MSTLAGKKILLGVSGGIAAYKSPDLVRRLRERGAEVQVVMTAGARQFVTAMTFQAVSGRPVRDDLWDESGEAAMSHIELARWADLVLVAPATADLLSRLAAGRADDLLTTLILACAAPIAVAPAMNRVMWSQAATQANVQLLRERRFSVMGPGDGDQACGEVGEGRMLEPLELVARCEALFASLGAAGGTTGTFSTPAGLLAGARVLITAGPTRERIDPVRFISNRSSGKMGFAIAAAARAAGAEVVLIAGPVSLATPAGVRRLDVESAADMMDCVQREVGACQIFISTAAVADYRPSKPKDQKIKKTEVSLDIGLERTQDILANVAARAERPYVVGFAAETEKIEFYAMQKLEKKNLDLIAANEVGDDKVFDKDENALLVLWRGGRRELGPGSKCMVAEQLVELIAGRYKGGDGERRAGLPNAAASVSAVPNAAASVAAAVPAAGASATVTTLRA